MIRRITSDGTVSTVTDDLLQKPGLAGMVSGYQTGIAIDSHGAFYLPNLVDRTVRRLSAQGEVTLVGGASQEPGSADGLAGNARFVAPLAVAVDANDNLYVSDGGYRSPTIRKAQLAGPPAITVQPQSQTVAAGGSAQFTVTASGVPTPTYQWRFNGAPIAGATDTTFGIFFAQSANAGQYSVVVTNALGSVTSDLATLAVTSTSSPPPSAASGGSGGGGVGAGFVTLLAISAAVRRLTAGRRA